MWRTLIESIVNYHDAMLIWNVLYISAQRSAHELPAVERQDVECCSVLGGLRMILTGQNFTSESRVLFTEKTQGGQAMQTNPH